MRRPTNEGQRFTVALSAENHQHLRSKAFHEGKSMALVVNELLDQDRERHARLMATAAKACKP